MIHIPLVVLKVRLLQPEVLGVATGGGLPVVEDRRRQLLLGVLDPRQLGPGLLAGFMPGPPAVRATRTTHLRSLYLSESARRRDLAAGRRRSRAPRGRDRLPGRPPHLGAESPATPTRPLRGARRRALARRLAGGLLPVRVLSRVIRGKCLSSLRAALGRLSPLTDPAQFHRRFADSARTEWVVHAKPPFGGPERVLKYLARYTHRVAISNRRLTALEDGRVTFRWKDYADGGGRKTMTLQATEFIRQFLLHVLPTGFVRIRHYGFLANRDCREKLELWRNLLATLTPPAGAGSFLGSKQAGEGRPEVHACPACGRGRMGIVETLPAAPIHWSGRVEQVPMPDRAGIDTY